MEKGLKGLCREERETLKRRDQVEKLQLQSN